VIGGLFLAALNLPEQEEDVERDEDEQQSAPNDIQQMYDKVSTHR
jgi:hypothetical protein